MINQNWLIVESSLEDELAKEKLSRSILACDDLEQIRKVCSDLFKANWTQRQLLIQAVNRIAELEQIS